MICSCGHHFAPTQATHKGAQVFCEQSGAPYLYLLIFNCPRVYESGEACASSRCLIMYDSTGGEDEQLEAIAAE